MGVRLTMSESPRSRRPAERQLITQFEAERESLIEGFENRKAVLRWGQRIAVRSLGQIPQNRFHQLAKEFVPDGDNIEGVLLSALLMPESRSRNMDDDVATGLRKRWAAEVLGPVQVRAFRDLRKDAGEYVGESEKENRRGAGYQPAKQSFMMRPSLSELDKHQSAALERVLGGLEDRDEILKWGDELTSATRGEPIDPDRPPGSFIPKAYRELSTVDLLTLQTDSYARARQAFIAHWLLPAFNRGVRDLTGRTAEEPGDESENYGPGEVA